ncbi:MAG: extracellular solute-binding protein [Chloroflexota bacterium]|nr:extracellular solute-binding protein [Chloroflexota bacterium]
MKKSLSLLVMLSLLVGLLVAPVAAQDPVVIDWFVGLGTGTDQLQIDTQRAVVEAFNASHDDIELRLTLAASNAVAVDTLSTLIAGNTPPDIVGPVGFTGANSFAGQWLDLAPLVESSGYDLSQYPESLINLYRTSEGLIGIPFAVFPALLFYNVELFDEAGLNYPPSEFGVPYVMPDGTEVEWTYDTLAEIAQILTVDANGSDASMEGFDPAAIEQFGFIHQWSSQRAELSTFGGAEFYDDETGEVTIPEWWAAQAEFTRAGLWDKHFMPNSTYENSQLFTPTVFASGRAAMARVQLWYTCCLGDLTAQWDLAVVPSYSGGTFAPTDADTYRILASTDHPNEAFTVLTYLQGEAALELLTTYGAFPALLSLQEPAIAAKAEQYPSVQNWGVITPSLEYAAVPNHEYYYPGFNQGEQRFADFRTLMYGDTGADIDLAAELARLQADLQAIVDEAK